MTSPVVHLQECREIARRLRARADEMQADRVADQHDASVVAGGHRRAAVVADGVPDADDWTAGHFTAGGGGQLVGSVYEVIERLVPRGAHRVTVCSNELAGAAPQGDRRAELHPARATCRRAADAAPAPGRTSVASRRRCGSRSRPASPATTGTRSCSSHWRAGVPTAPGSTCASSATARRSPECRRIVGRRGHRRPRAASSGHLDRPAMLRELVQSDVSVLPLHDTRVDRARFPLKMLDALACGTALAASDIGMAARHADPPRVGVAVAGRGHGRAGRRRARARREPRAPGAPVGGGAASWCARYDVDVVCGRWAELIS